MPRLFRGEEMVGMVDVLVFERGLVLVGRVGEGGCKGGGGGG